jgi:hypothetical protein
MCGNCKLDKSEREELEELRKRIDLYNEIFTVEKLDEIWRLGWFSHKLASETGDTSEEVMKQLHKEDINDLIASELESLCNKENYGREIGED